MPTEKAPLRVALKRKAENMMEESKGGQSDEVRASNFFLGHR